MGRAIQTVCCISECLICNYLAEGEVIQLELNLNPPFCACRHSSRRLKFFSDDVSPLERRNKNDLSTDSRNSV